MQRLIEELRIQLNDTEAIWLGDELIAQFIKDAMCLIAQLRPERFTKARIMKANRGELQCVPACCSKLISVDGVTDKCGNPLNYISEGSTALAKAFTKQAMDDVETSYTFSIVSAPSGQFEVSPPIKPSQDVYFRITCVEVPTTPDMDENFGNCSIRELVLHYALYRAYYMETESKTSLAMGDRHLKMFYDLLQLQRKIDQEDDDE